MCDRAMWLERRQNARAWATEAHDMGATHAFTFNPDYRYARSRSQAQDIIQRVAVKLYKELNRELRATSRRTSRLEDADSLRFIGSYELRDRREMIYPHAHLAIALRPGEDFKLHRFMLDRWGTVDRCGRTRQEVHIPANRPLAKFPRSRPEYHLTPIGDLAGWMEYAAKQSDEFTLPALPGEYLKLAA